MEMMKMIVVLVLSCVLCVSAEVQHEDIGIRGCSDSGGEDMYGLDGEQVWYADFINQRGVMTQPGFVDPVSYPGAYEAAEANQPICKQNLKLFQEVLKNFSRELDAPSRPIIYPRDYVKLGVKNILICQVTDFYPAPVIVSWTKNEEKVTEGISINVPYPKKDGSFNQFAKLEFIPQQGDIYSCTVRHPALKDPLTRIWDVDETQPSVGPAVFCGVGLTLGLLGVAVGTFFLIKGNECR